jgi:hypothetical protein
MSEAETTREEETVRRLLQEAGPRPALPEDEIESLKETARAEWRRRYGVRSISPRRFRPWMAVAAAALLAAAGLLWWGRTRPPAFAAAVASVERSSGVAHWEIGHPLPAGSELDTGTGSDKPGRIALRMAGGASVRLDAGTRVRLASPTVVELGRGAVYVDTGADAGRREEVAVRTPAGDFEGVGTQFEVRTDGEGGTARLRVREGRVRLARGREEVLTGVGEELVVRGDGGLVRSPIALYGPEWDWVLEAAPIPDIEGVKVRTFLGWISRETGWRVEFADQETAAAAESVVLHGSVAHLTPADAIGVVLSSAGLGHRVSDGTLLVFIPRKGRS